MRLPFHCSLIPFWKCLFSAYQTVSCMSWFRYEEIPDEWEPPAPQPYTDMGNLHYYLLEPDAYDQYSTVMNRGGTVQIWLNSVPEPIKLVEKEVMLCQIHTFCVCFIHVYWLVSFPMYRDGQKLMSSGLQWEPTSPPSILLVFACGVDLILPGKWSLPIQEYNLLTSLLAKSKLVLFRCKKKNIAQKPLQTDSLFLLNLGQNFCWSDERYTDRCPLLITMA